jgi:hypothetical protein
MTDHKGGVMTPSRIRRLLFIQAALLLVGWFAILACQGAANGSPVASSPAADPRRSPPSEIVEGFGVVAAVIAFGWAGKIRAQINCELPREHRAAPLAHRPSEAA